MNASQFLPIVTLGAGWLSTQLGTMSVVASNDADAISFKTCPLYFASNTWDRYESERKYVISVNGLSRICLNTIAFYEDQTTTLSNRYIINSSEIQTTEHEIITRRKQITVCGLKLIGLGWIQHVSCASRLLASDWSFTRDKYNPNWKDLWT